MWQRGNCWPPAHQQTSFHGERKIGDTWSWKCKYCNVWEVNRRKIYLYIDQRGFLAQRCNLWPPAQIPEVNSLMERHKQEMQMCFHSIFFKDYFFIFISGLFKTKSKIMLGPFLWKNQINPDKEKILEEGQLIIASRTFSEKRVECPYTCPYNI